VHFKVAFKRNTKLLTLCKFIIKVKGIINETDIRLIIACFAYKLIKIYKKMPPNHENTKLLQKKYLPIPIELDIIGKKIVDSAYTVHKNLGPGLLEKVYEICFCHELAKRGLKYQRQLDIPVIYDGLIFDEGLRLDVMVENEIICELKAIEIINPLWEAQVLSHLKLTNKRLGYLINFNVANIGEGIRRFVV
jgi:GxxExxY protein